MNKIIISNIIGAIAYLIMFIYMFTHAKRRTILICNVCANLLFILHFYLLDAYTGIYCSVFGVVHYLLYAFKGKNKFFKTLVVPIFCTICYIIIGIFTYDGYQSIFPIMCNVIACMIYWFDKEIVIKICVIPICIMWIIYNASVKSYSGVLFQFILMVLAIVYIFRYINKMKRDAVTQIEKQE